MDQVFLEMLKQAPSLGVLVFLVAVFLKHLQQEGKESRDALDRNTDGMKTLADAVTELRIESAKLKQESEKMAQANGTGS